ncbi:hypothetical protein HNR65_001367 [Desulfosalsimonas propionicica]|uniref:Uncharacterized protein n=1 Tax=Desulfosalsimonas propionicica TaxID=332175 RepID=A0A7W0C8E9_9BACT|nr:hypothetical protein [Desulfosalsimonas propionicica]
MQKPSQATSVDAAIVTSPAIEGRKPCGQGRFFSLRIVFADSANAFAEISKTRAFALKQFEIFRLRHWLNLFAKKINVASKTRPRPSGFLGNLFQIR